MKDEFYYYDCEHHLKDENLQVRIQKHLLNYFMEKLCFSEAWLIYLKKVKNAIFFTVQADKVLWKSSQEQF